MFKGSSLRRKEIITELKKEKESGKEYLNGWKKTKYNFHEFGKSYLIGKSKIITPSDAVYVVGILKTIIF